MKDWLKPGQNDITSNSILIIDDEADYASLNTNKPEKDPTKINGLIRDIYNNFPIATYVGFTATPFANVFVNPYDDESYQDLFPSNFVIQLKSPSNYFGYEKVFFDENGGRHLDLLDENEESFLPVIHKKDAEFNELTRSLKDAILSFLIGNVIRTKRGHQTKHRSMMINISWLNDVQERIRERVAEYVSQLKRIIAQDGQKSLDAFLRNSEMKLLYQMYMKDDFYTEEIVSRDKVAKPLNQQFSFEEIKKGLNAEIKLFDVFVINSRKKGEERFDYESYKDEGARVILIGGFVLSRGLTLEGLMISYYSRNVSAYDTLLQMCRWFGYRPKYEDLCRIFLTETALIDFEEVIEAVEDLKDQFREMSLRGRTPAEFGLMVRESPNSAVTEELRRRLISTARNKTRHSVKVERRLNFGGVYTDTSKLFKEGKANQKNKEAILTFLSAIVNKGLSLEVINGRNMFRGVPAHLVAQLLGEIAIPYENTKFNAESIAEYIIQKAATEKWDILIASGGSKRPLTIDSVEVSPIQRSFVTRKEEQIVRISGSNNRLSEPGMFRAGLTEEQVARAQAHARMRCEGKIPPAKSNDPVAIDYLSLQERSPLLIIFPIDLKTETDGNEDNIKQEIKSVFGADLLWGFGVGFPAKETGVPILYRANLVKRDEQLASLVAEEEDDDE